MDHEQQHTEDPHETSSTALDVVHPTSAQIAAVADAWAGSNAFTRYQRKKSQQTRERQHHDLALFNRFLATIANARDDLFTDPAQWHSITYGIVEAFLEWQLQQGYAIGSINVRLATIKAYARLAMHAGVLEVAEVTKILSIKGYRHAEGVHIDETREQCRTGHKKATPVSIPVGYLHLLKSRHDRTTAIGRRDALLMCLLLDLGLRCGEVALLRVEHLDLATGTLSFYRPKVDLVQTHMLPPDTLEAARLYLENDKPTGMLFAGIGRQDKKTPGISTRTINARVRVIGERVGLHNLSPHDCRHAWATHATRLGTDVKRLQDAGGWKSPYMALRYAESSRIANEGVKLPRL